MFFYNIITNKMVKNAGGNKAKGFARKHTNGGKNDNILRVSEDEGEIYSVVTKMCGNSMFECVGIDRIARLGHIRGKFSGKGKRDNIVQSGTWVLIGVREWDIKKEEEKQEIDAKSTKKAKLPQCDLLEVYTDNDKTRLRNEVVAEWKVLVKNDPTKIDNEDDNNFDYEEEIGFKFATDKDIERDALLKEAKSASCEKISMMDPALEAETEAKDDWISVDDL
jgi:translation initiation factor IF-1